MLRSFAGMPNHDLEGLTRRSLISRLRNWDDQESWQEFFSTYWRLIYSVAIKSGLSEQESQDVVQETVLSVAKKMPEFQYDRSKCTFKGWLMHVTRLRIRDQLRRRLPPERFRRGQPENDDTGTATVERVPEDSAQGWEALWDAEWRKHLLDAAMERVKARVNPNHFQIFYLNVIKRYSGPEVARMLGVTLAQVYVVRHRLSKLIKAEAKLLEESR